MPLAKLQKLAKPIAEAEIIDLTGTGEPLLHPDFSGIVEYISGVCRNKTCFQIISNGSLVGAEHARLLAGRIHRVGFSVNAARADTYANMMPGGNFHKTISRIREFLGELDDADRGKIAFSCVTSQENYREMRDFILLAKESGVTRVSFLPIITSNETFKQQSLYAIPEEYNAVAREARELAKQLNMTANIRIFGEVSADSDKREKKCFFPFTHCFIVRDGRMGICCFAGEHNCLAGDAFEDFDAMWFSEHLRKLRRERFYPECKACWAFGCLDNPDVHKGKR